MAKGEYFKQLPTWAKGLVAVAVIGGVGFVGYNIYKKIQQKNKEKDQKKELDSAQETIKNLTISGQKPTLDNFKLAQLANQIHSAMNGYGSDEAAIYRAFLQVKNDLDIVNLTKAYGIRKLSSGSWNLSPDFEGTLGQSITEELDAKEVAALNNILAKKGIKYRF
jgi:hypothetical protein